MQTKYNLYYRYINETTNTAITNEADYNRTEELFTAEHKVNADTEYLDGYTDNIYLRENPDKTIDDYADKIHSEADTAREQLITEGLNDRDKSNNLYVYNGTTKEYHKKFVPEQLGYKVANFSAVPKGQFPTGQDDFSKHFVMLNGNKPGVDGAFLVCKPDNINYYKTNYNEQNTDKEQMVLSGAKFANNMMFEWRNPQEDETYIPHYGETAANITEVSGDNVPEYYGGERVMDLTDEEGNIRKFLITDIVEYIPGTRQTGSETIIKGYRYGEPVYGTKYSWAYSGTTLQNSKTYSGNLAPDHEYYGTIFFNCGTVIPKQENVLVNKVTKQLLNENSFNGNKLNPSEIGDDVLIKWQEAMTMYDGVTLPQTIDDTSTKTQYTNAIGGSIDIPKQVLYIKGWFLDTLKKANMSNYILKLNVVKENITRYAIPEHEEYASSDPYLIKDQYKKIESSPWVLHSVHNSLEDALKSSKKLIQMIGIDNVKLQKHVPIDQKILIK